MEPPRKKRKYDIKEEKTNVNENHTNNFQIMRVIKQKTKPSESENSSVEEEEDICRSCFGKINPAELHGQTKHLECLPCGRCGREQPKKMWVRFVDSISGVENIPVQCICVDPLTNEFWDIILDLLNSSIKNQSRGEYDDIYEAEVWYIMEMSLKHFSTSRLNKIKEILDSAILSMNFDEGETAYEKRVLSLSTKVRQMKCVRRRNSTHSHPISKAMRDIKNKAIDTLC